MRTSSIDLIADFPPTQSTRGSLVARPRKTNLLVSNVAPRLPASGARISVDTLPKKIWKPSGLTRQM
ncbi:hypothetical protein D3C83_68240 [compost metagenome]